MSNNCLNNEPLNDLRTSFAGLVYREAKKFVGCKEDPKTPNRSYCVDEIQKMGGWTPTAEPWCAMFVYAVVQKASQMMGIKNLLTKTKSSTAMKDKASSNGIVVNTKPTKGCLFWYPRTGGGHIGFVIDVKGDKIYTIEGNTSDQVKLGQRTINSSMKFIHIEDMSGGKTIIPMYLKVGIPVVVVGAIYGAKKFL